MRLGPVINARLEMKDGRIYRAALQGKSNLSPRDQLYSILDATEDRFEFVQCEVDEPDEIQLPTSNVILEHARRRDEGE